MNKRKLRSLLFVPAREKMLGKISSSDADAWIVDLEDSIANTEKSAALSAAVDFLRHSPKASDCFVRIDRNYLCEQVMALKTTAIRGFMIPKAENCDFLRGAEAAFAKRENIALIETPKGLLGIESLVQNAEISALAFGAEDYTATVNMQNTEENLAAIKCRIVMYAKAYGKCVYDTPSFCINDIEKAASEARRSASLGFDGKMAIHPKLIPGVNNAFSMFDIERMKKIVSSFEQQGGGVLVFEDCVYEKMHIDRFKRIIRESQEIPTNF